MLNCVEKGTVPFSTLVVEARRAEGGVSRRAGASARLSKKVEAAQAPPGTEVEGAFPLNRGISRSAGGWIVWPLKTSSESFLWLFVQYSVDTGHKGAGRVSFLNQF